ncbi:MAG: hypothetical protein JNJ39_09360 [Blastocatellia bacterium]|nr:hypothetical protein [Blastocatellia bacterium]
MRRSLPALPRDLPGDDHALLGDGRGARVAAAHSVAAGLRADLCGERGFHASRERVPRRYVRRLCGRLRAVRGRVRTDGEPGRTDETVRGDLPRMRRKLPPHVTDEHHRVGVEPIRHDGSVPRGRRFHPLVRRFRIEKWGGIRC